MNWGGGDDYAFGKCAAVLTDGRQHQVRPSEYFHRDRGYSPWLECVNCKRVLWGLYTIHENENEPW